MGTFCDANYIFNTKRDKSYAFIICFVTESAEDPLAFLRSQPQFTQMRAVLQRNPALLNAVLQQIGQTNPALLRLISRHQDAFVRMLNEPMTGESTPGSATGAPTTPLLGSTPSAASGGTPDPALGQGVIQISPQDKEAIERVSIKEIKTYISFVA